jgi:predicted dehydrogenase
MASAPREERIALGSQATHHFDLINGGSTPTRFSVCAGSLLNYGKSGPFRHTHCRPCPHKAKCPYHWDITTNENLVNLYVKCESADGYHRDGCVFKEDIDIFDTMNAVVKYSNGVNMSYSVNTFMPIEGYRVAFNGTKGRLEVRDYERQAWDPGEETEMYSSGTSASGRVDVPSATEGTGWRRGFGSRLQESRGLSMRLPGSRAGAMSCPGIAARKSVDAGRPIKIADLVKIT